MTENRLKLVGAICGAALIVGFGSAIYGLTFSCGPSGVPIVPIKEYYADDNNYRTVIGQIVEYKNDNYVFDKMQISMGDIEYMCQLPVKNADILRCNEFDFSPGGVYKFTIGNPHDPQFGYMIVAVKSVMYSYEYLSYDIGKANLIDTFLKMTNNNPNIEARYSVGLLC